MEDSRVGATGEAGQCPYWQGWYGCDRTDCALCEDEPGSEACLHQQELIALVQEDERLLAETGRCSYEACPDEEGACARCIARKVERRWAPYGGWTAYFSEVLWHFEAAEGSEWN